MSKKNSNQIRKISTIEMKEQKNLKEKDLNQKCLKQKVKISLKIQKTGKTFYIYQNSILRAKFNDELRIKKENFFVFKQLPSMKSLKKINFEPPMFGITTLGNSHGFDTNGSTSGFILWINKKGIMIDPPPYSSQTLRLQGIPPLLIEKVVCYILILIFKGDNKSLPC
jgi:hypothetical protein